MKKINEIRIDRHRFVKSKDLTPITIIDNVSGDQAIRKIYPQGGLPKPQ